MIKHNLRLLSVLQLLCLLFLRANSFSLNQATSRHIRLLSAVNSDDIQTMEKEVLAAAQAKLDARRIVEALTTDDDGSAEALSTAHFDQWKIALAAASVSSVAGYLAIKSITLSMAIFLVTFFLANTDPLEQDGDNLGGALARLLGRATIRSVQYTQPKVKALARAVVTGEEEIVSLRTKLAKAEQEVSDLTLWKEQRLLVDEVLPRFNLDELKDLARENQLVVGGSKTQLLMRLVEAKVVDIDSGMGTDGNTNAYW
jgi:hypothetical protein